MSFVKCVYLFIPHPCQNLDYFHQSGKFPHFTSQAISAPPKKQPLLCFLSSKISFICKQTSNKLNHSTGALLWLALVVQHKGFVT